MNTGRRLATWIVLDGQAYGPHHELTADQAARITNPLAWADDPPPDDVTPSPALEPDSSTPNTIDGPPADLPVLTEPPRAGRGSSVEAWRAYAVAHQVDISASADRAAIIAACEHAGLTESPPN